MTLGNRVREGIWKVKRDIHNTASVSSTRLGQGDTSRSRCVWVYNKRNTVNKMWEW